MDLQRAFEADVVAEQEDGVLTVANAAEEPEQAQISTPEQEEPTQAAPQRKQVDLRDV